MSKVGHSGINLGHGSCQEGKTPKKLQDFVKIAARAARVATKLRLSTGKTKIGTGTSTYMPTPKNLACFVKDIYKDKSALNTKVTTGKGHDY